eukprot:TRINITY_DN28790_c0_g1_i1.p1 TRINITY_DN28790_c0_g1~~TRINITY_DN28790_c0_g1_i1.p1  ORF type:complete len:116 (-),score=35.30 TRINITY_DN28790_c0_g1_i1:106-453(-)
MGQSSSLPQLVGSLATKLAYSLSGSEYNYISTDEHGNQDTGALARWRGRDHLVYQRMGSQYFDQDDDLAHEFYEESVDGDKLVMKRKLNNLRPEGMVMYKVPRIHNEFPCVLMAE